MIRYAFCVVALFATADLCPASAYMDTGNTLLRACEDQDPRFKGACTGISSGYYDMMAWLGYHCDVGDADRIQLREILVKYLRDNPDRRHLPAAKSALEAYSAAFRCRLGSRRP